jgi:3-oxoacyl-[acyl-carrier protein] reductase
MFKKNILISGGSSGLGFEIVKYFSKLHNIYVFSRKKRTLNSNINFFSVDLSDEHSSLNAFEVLKKKISKIDLIVCCAGNSKGINKNNILNKKNLISFFNSNLFTFTNLINSYLKVFKKKKTNIIVISSIASKKIIDAPIGYSLAKNNLDFIVRILAKKFASNKIKFNIISPGNILIKNNNWFKKFKKNSKYVKNYIKNNVPLNSFVQPKEIINIIRLLSDETQNITGGDFVVDGGQTL